MGLKNIFKEMMTENYPHFLQDIKLQIQESKQTASRKPSQTHYNKPVRTKVKVSQKQPEKMTHACRETSM